MQSVQRILKNALPEIPSAHPSKPMKKTQAQETSSNCSNTAKADKRIDLLFARFAAIYGHIWRSQFKDEDYFLPFAKKEWQAALVDFSDKVLDQAITECGNFYELPPTLPQLLQCRRKIKQQSSVYAVKQDYTGSSP
jgi:hypothetical protein